MEEEIITKIRAAVLGHAATAKICEECGRPITGLDDFGALLPQP